MWTSILLYLSLFLSSFIIPSHSAERCHPNDKRALLQIKQSFGQPYPFPSWDNNTDCCRYWNGVKCNHSTNRVITVDVVGGELSGQIPAAIGDLPYLQELRFHKLSNITGSIPYSITKLQNLLYLDLSWNNLSGPIPSFLTRLKSLSILYLSFNSFSGSIPPSFSKMPKLGGLSLDRNKLTGSIPDSFGSFKQTNFYIQLCHNQLSGPIPTTLGCMNFTFIDLSRNQLTGDASFLFGKDKDSLQNLDLSRNQLEFDMSKVKFDSSLVNLNSIDLNHNKIYGKLPASLADLPQLLLLNVSYNRLCGRIPSGGRLSEFDEYSYFHNKCLCGSPLSACH